MVLTVTTVIEMFFNRALSALAYQLKRTFCFGGYHPLCEIWLLVICLKIFDNLYWLVEESIGLQHAIETMAGLILVCDLFQL